MFSPSFAEKEISVDKVVVDYHCIIVKAIARLHLRQPAIRHPVRINSCPNRRASPERNCSRIIETDNWRKTVRDLSTRELGIVSVSQYGGQDSSLAVRKTASAVLQHCRRPGTVREKLLSIPAGPKKVKFYGNSCCLCYSCSPKIIEDISSDDFVLSYLLTRFFFSSTDQPATPNPSKSSAPTTPSPRNRRT